MTLTGVFRDEITPLQCRRQYPNYENHRLQWKETVRARLLEENKRLVKLRFLADGWVADWEEIVPEIPGTYIDHEQPESSSSVRQRHALPPAIGRSQSIPVDLTFWDDDEDIKPKVDAKTEPDSPPRPRDPPLAPRLDAPNPDRTAILQSNLVAVRHTRPEGLTGPPPGTPTGPRGRRLNPDAPRVSRRTMTVQREPEYGPYAEYRYLRRDQPSSLQLVRVPASIHPTSGGSRARPRERRDGRPWVERRIHSYGTYDDDSRRPRPPFEAQRSLFRTVVDDRPQRGLDMEWLEAPQVAVQGASSSEQMQLDNLVMPQLDPAEEDLLPSLVNAMEEDRAPALRGEDDEMLLRDLIIDETSVPHSETIPLQDSMPVDSNVLPDEQDLPSSDSSDEGDSSDADEPAPRPCPLPVPGAHRLLASINLATVEDALNTPTSNTIPTVTVTLPPVSKRPVERKPTSKKPLPNATQENAKPSTSNAVRGSVKAPLRFSMQYRQAETVKLPKPEYARARRLLAPADKPLVCISMPGDVQFVRDDERTRVEQWSLPAPARNQNGGKSLAYVVTDACLLGESSIVMVHETGPHPASLICIPDDDAGIPVRHDLLHTLVPTSSTQRRGILSSVCGLNDHRFFTGGIDKRVLLWGVQDVDNDDYPPSTASRPSSLKAAVEPLDIAHAASVRALAYSHPRNWLVSAAGAKLAVTDVSTGQAVVRTGKQKWASNDVFNVHFHAIDPNILLLETGDLDKQARIYDLRKIQQAEIAPERLIGSTETGAISQFVRGDWAKSLIVRPSSQNMVKVWDTRQPDRPLSVHTLSHAVTHCIFIDDCRTIGAIGEHFVTFLDARA